ncbi:hypothetical protein C8R45DRAFT_965781 [Mycena sanguinolenta]|nr:hypothetical protein C8R45DRAFT_965781 [Mycena sanguinolenta]
MTTLGRASLFACMLLRQPYTLYSACRSFWPSEDLQRQRNSASPRLAPQLWQPQSEGLSPSSSHKLTLRLPLCFATL